MEKPIVAIVGRPNTGKSTLFNRLTGTRKAIVEGQPGVTRDRIYDLVNWQNKEFELIDTGGIDPYDEDKMKKQVRYQAELAVEEASLILFVVDAKTGITAIDHEIAQFLRKTGKKIILTVNKVDNFSKAEELSWEFYNLGLGSPVIISAEHGKNTGDLLDKIINELPTEKKSEIEETVLNIAVVGKPNSGKSSLINYILGKQRVIVSEIPGTTRDAIDTLIKKDDLYFNLIDTAGLRRKARVKEDIEYYSNLRTIRAIDRADGVLIMIDAVDGISSQDKKIAGYIHDNGKAVVFAFNKWDLIEKNPGTMEFYQKEIFREIKFMRYAPVTYISAKTGKRVNEVLDLMEFVIDQNSKRIKTGILNEVIEEAVQLREPPVKKTRRLKVFYATQVGVKPPTIVVFVNDPQLMHFSYQRYLENVIRKKFGFEGTPIRIQTRKRT